MQSTTDRQTSMSKGMVVRCDGDLQMCSLAESCGFSMCKDLVVPGLF